MKVEMRAIVTVIMEFPTEAAAEHWASLADVEELLREGGEAEEGVRCFFLEDEDTDDDAAT